MLPIVVCSLGDASITEGEVSEAFQFAVLKQLPIIYLVQDNHWGISVTAEEARTMNAFEFAAGFKGMQRIQVDGSDFEASYSSNERSLRFCPAGAQALSRACTSSLIKSSYQRRQKRILPVRK